jgi:hypothetical protein
MTPAEMPTGMLIVYGGRLITQREYLKRRLGALMMLPLSSRVGLLRGDIEYCRYVLKWINQELTLVNNAHARIQSATATGTDESTASVDRGRVAGCDRDSRKGVVRDRRTASNTSSISKSKNQFYERLAALRKGRNVRKRSSDGAESA